MALRLLIVMVILAVPLEISGCGPFLPVALFHTARGPDQDAAFARGQLGILLPTYDRIYQVVAYRYLTGAGLNDAERREVFPPPVEAAPPSPDSNPWLAARNKVKGVKPIPYIYPDRMIQEPNHFEVYENCHDDAFRTAAATLQNRIQQFGDSDPAVADWIAAQDEVFSDCSTGSAIPQPASDPRLRADRAYQIASAKFYSRQYDAAQQDFQAIAADQSSPWHGLAPYIAARCLIRSGKLAEAESQLQRVAADPSLARWHAPATSLLGYVRTQLHPVEHMHAVALTIVRPNSQATISQDLTDYRFLFDKDIEPAPSDDLTDWIRSFQAGRTGALEQWRAKRTLPWLVAALQGLRPGNPVLPEILAAAREVKPDSPAYVTVGYHLVILSPSDQARAKADELLRLNLPISARNQVREERLRLAQSFDEFLQFAPRRLAVDYYGQAANPPVDFLDGDAAQVLDGEVPLSTLRQAAASKLLPENIRAELSRVISVRTVLLAPSPTFDQVFWLLHNPGLRPYVASGFTSRENSAEIDNFRDNWWCGHATPSGTWQQAQRSTPQGFDLLPVADRNRSSAEQKQLREIAAAPDWLGDHALAFAQAHPQDPRVPEALYLVVRATRFGCTDGDTGSVSQNAFNLLHRRYPTSEWTRKTPFWYR